MTTSTTAQTSVQNQQFPDVAMPTAEYLAEKNKIDAMPRVETSFKMFKSYIPSVKYVFKNGKEAIFREGKFSTNIQIEIDELVKEVEAKHPHIYIDDSEVNVDYSTEDPLAGLKERLRKQLEKEMLDKKVDAGTSTQPALKPASSSDVSDTSADSSSTTA